MNRWRNTKVQPPPEQKQLPCPRCDSTDTKFRFYSHHKLSKPCHFCKFCRHYWIQGGTLHDVSGAGSSRKRSRPKNLSKGGTTTTVGRSIPLNQGGSVFCGGGKGPRGFGLGGGGGCSVGEQPISTVLDSGLVTAAGRVITRQLVSRNVELDIPVCLNKKVDQMKFYVRRTRPRIISPLESIPEETPTHGAENGRLTTNSNDNEAANSGTAVDMQSFLTEIVGFELEARIVKLERTFVNLGKFYSQQ